MDALIGRNVGVITDCHVIRYEVGEYLMKACKLRRERLGYEAEEALSPSDQS